MKIKQNLLELLWKKNCHLSLIPIFYMVSTESLQNMYMLMNNYNAYKLTENVLKHYLLIS